MAAPRVVAVVTGSRADLGLLLPVMRAVDAHSGLSLHTIVTGQHLLQGTASDVTDAGLTIDAQLPMQQPGHATRIDDVAALGRGITALAARLQNVSPTFVLVLGDRIEAFAAAAAGSVAGIRIAHMHGGDRAQGVADEAMRHAITKLAHLHLPATAQSAERIMAMGEPTERVHIVGSPAIDDIAAIPPADDADAPDVIVMHHPIGDDIAIEQQRMARILAALADTGLPHMVMSPNHDAGHLGIRAAITDAGIDAVEHLPRARFIALLKRAQLIVGNSSAGLIEAAACGTACVNVGSRQAGREMPGHVVCCDNDPSSLDDALRSALDMDVGTLEHPYGQGDTGRRTAELLANIDLAAIPIAKRNAY